MFFKLIWDFLLMLKNSNGLQVVRFRRLYGGSGQDPVAKILLMDTTKNTLKTDRKMIPMSNLHCFKTIKFVFMVLVCCPLAAPAWIFNLDFKLKEEK